MKIVTLQEAQQNLAALMALVGQGEDVLITHDTLPPVKLVESSHISQKYHLSQFLSKAQIIKAQQLVAQYIPADQDLVAELLEDRQQELHDE